MDEENGDPFDLGASHVAAAQAQLELARRSGNAGSIGLAHLNLAATLAGVGDHEAAAAEYAALIGYLDLAGSDDEAERRRWLRMTSPAAPPPQVEDVDPAALQAFARIERADSLLALGRRPEAAAELEAAAPACRGFGRGRLRRRLKQVQARMTQAAAPPETQPHDAPAPAVDEQVAAADDLLSQGRFDEAARLALAVLQRCPDDRPGLRARARQVLGLSLEGREQPEDAAEVLADSFADYVTADEPVMAATVAIALAWRWGQLGRRDDAIELLRRALSLTEKAGDPQVRAQLFTDLGSLLDQADRPVEARQSFEAALATAERLVDPEPAANATHGLAVLLGSRPTESRDDEVEALSLLDSCRRIYEQLGFTDRVAGCEHEAAALLGRLGSFEAAAARYHSALLLYEQLPPTQRDTGSWPDEVADVRANLAALKSGRTGDPGLFRSGGHAMSHGD